MRWSCPTASLGGECGSRGAEVGAGGGARRSGAGRGAEGRSPRGGGARLERAGAGWGRGGGCVGAGPPGFCSWPSRRLAQVVPGERLWPRSKRSSKACRGRQGRSVIITRYQSCSKMVEMLVNSPALPGLVSQAPPTLNIPQEWNRPFHHRMAQRWFPRC